MQDEQTPRKPIEQALARTHSNCHYQWLLEEKFNMMQLGFLTKKQNQRLVFWVGKVSEAVRNGPIPRNELDVCLRPVGSPLASLAIVSGWTETYEKMLSDTRFWIRSGNGSIRKVFLLRWSKTPLHEIGCDLEVYEWDKSTKRERFSQHEIVLPENEDQDELQVVRVLFSEIFGKKFSDADPNSGYIFSLGRLRRIAKKAIEEDGYGLRTVASGRGAEGAALGGAENSILQELPPFPPSSHLLGRVNQLQPQTSPATVGIGDFGLEISGPEQALSTLAVDSNGLDSAPSIDNPKNDGDVPLGNDNGQGVPLLDREDLGASQPPTSPRNTTCVPVKGQENPNDANPLPFPGPGLGAAPHIATSPEPDDPNKPIDAESPGCGSPFSDPALEQPEPTSEVSNPPGLESLDSKGCQTSQPGVLSHPPDDNELPISSLANTELPVYLKGPKEDPPNPRDLVDQTDDPGDIIGNTTGGGTPERVLGGSVPSELPESGPNPSVIHVPGHTDNNAGVKPESGPSTRSDGAPVIAGPAPEKPGGEVPAEAHQAVGSVEQRNDISLGPSGNSTCSPGGGGTTPAEVEGVGKVDPEPSASRGPDSSTLILQTENPENASNDSSPRGTHVLGWPAVGACVALPDGPNAEVPENTHLGLDATKDIPNERESESIADSPGKIELSLHDSKPADVGPVNSPGLPDGGNGSGTDSELLERGTASPRLIDDPHIPKAPEGTGSVHIFEAAPRILEKPSSLLKSSQDSDVSDSSYTSDILDISGREAGKDTNASEEIDPIVNPRVDSEPLEEVSPSLDIDILEALKDNDAVGDVDPTDTPRICSEPPEENIGSFESPPNPLQHSDLLEATTGVEPIQENGRVNSLNANSESLLDERLQPVQRTDSDALEAADVSGSIEELDSIGNPGADPKSLEGVNTSRARSVDIGDPEALGNAGNTIDASDPEPGSKPTEGAGSAPRPLQPSDVSSVAQAGDSAQQIHKTDTAVPLQDSISPVVENVVQDEASVLVDGATDDAIAGGVSLSGGAVSPGLPPGSATENTSQDAALEGIENPKAVGLEVAEDVLVDTEEEFGVSGAQRREEAKDSDPENLPVVELQTGGISLPDPLELTTNDDRSVSSSDSTWIPVAAEGLESVPGTRSAVSVTTPLSEGDFGEFFDIRSDASETKPDLTEIPEALGTEDRTTLSELLDTPHSHQVDPPKSPEIATPCQSTSVEIDGNLDLNGTALKKEEPTRPHLHLAVVESDVDSQKGTEEVDEAEPQNMEMGSARFYAAAVLPPTPPFDRRVPECLECGQAVVLGPSGQKPSEYAPAGNSKSLEQEGNLQSKGDGRSGRRFSVLGAISSFLGKPASPKSPATPSQASNVEVHGAAGTVVTPRGSPAVRTPGSRRSRSQNERKVSWDDIVNGKKRARSESLSSLEESSPDQLFLPLARAGGIPDTGEGPYAGDPLGIGVQLGGNVYPLMSTEVHTSEHSALGGSVIGAGASPLTRNSPTSDHYEEPPFTDTRHEVVRTATASYCRRASDETEDKESLVASPRPGTGAANQAITASPIKSPFFTSLFPWSDAQRIPFSAPSTMQREAPTPAVGPLGEYSSTRSPAVGRTPRVGAESPYLSGQASCFRAPDSARGPGPAPPTNGSSDPNAFGSARCIHGVSLAADIHPAGDKSAPPPGLPSAFMRGTQGRRHQSVIQEEREEFAHSFMDEPGRISPEQFSRLELLIKRFAIEHFSQLPVSLRVFESPAPPDRSPFPPEFLCTSSLGKRLRVAAVQNIICRHLVNNIFSATVPSFCFNMEVIAEELMKLDPLKQALWQVLTVEALEALPQYEVAAAKLRQKTVNEILVSIGAISASPAATLTESLQNLVKSAQEAWEPTFKSKAQTIPEVDVENGTANFKMDPEDSLVRESSGLRTENITRPVLCLFPAIYQIVDGHNILVAPGRALFSDFCHSAEMELQVRLDTWTSDQKYARRASFMRPPFAPHNTPPTSPESLSGRWSTRRTSHEYFGHNQWCSHPNDIEDEMVDFWDVSRRLKEHDQEVLGHGRSTGSETFSESRSPYIGRGQYFTSGRRESVHSRREPAFERRESVYDRRAPVGGRRESFYGSRRESLRGSRDHYGW